MTQSKKSWEYDLRCGQVFGEAEEAGGSDREARLRADDGGGGFLLGTWVVLGVVWLIIMVRIWPRPNRGE